MSIPAPISIAADEAILSSAGVAEWQSDDVWFSQQDRSHAETKTDVETIRTDSINGSSFAILCIGRMLLQSPKFLYLPSRPIIQDCAESDMVP
jgi:hypothetical protein